MIKIEVFFQREVINQGEYITSADVLLPEFRELDGNEINFKVKNKKVKVKSFSQFGNTLHVKFGVQKELSTLTFDVNDFVNNFELPEVDIFISEYPGANYDITYNEDPYIKQFITKTFQHKGSQVSYYMYSSGNTKKKRPLIIFLHGSGERGFVNKLPLLGNGVPKEIYKYVKEKEDAVILVPQATWAPELNGWFRENVRNSLYSLIETVAIKEHIDMQRIYLTGVSNGGAATWYFAQKHPDVFAAIIPCCGYIFNDNKEFIIEDGHGRYMAPKKEEAKRLDKMPIWAFHSIDDPTVNVKGTIETIDMVRKYSDVKDNVKETIYEKGIVTPNAHASWERAFTTKEVLPWLFSQSKEGSKEV